MKCANHPKSTSTGACVECGKLFCDDCIIKAGRKRYCKGCAAEVLHESSGKSQNGNITITQQTTQQTTQESPVDEVVVHTVDSGTAARAGKWVASVILFFLAIGLLTKSIPAAIFILIISISWMPPFEAWLQAKYQFTIPTWIRVTSIFVAFFIVGVTG